MDANGFMWTYRPSMHGCFNGLYGHVIDIWDPKMDGL